MCTKIDNKTDRQLRDKLTETNYETYFKNEYKLFTFFLHKFTIVKQKNSLESKSGVKP